MGARTGNVFTVCSSPLSQSIGRGRISRVGPLVVRESRERREKDFAGKTEKNNAILAWNFPFFWAGSLVVRESRDRTDKLSDKNKEKKPTFFLAETKQEQQFSMENFHAEKPTFFWGGGGG